MEKKNLSRRAFIAFIFACQLFANQLRSESDFSLSDHYGSYNGNTDYEIINDRSSMIYDEHDYHTSCYYLNHYYKDHSGNFNSDAYLHRRYELSDNFSGGISSYQGTSTGPGPNGGYPGAPRGTYKTRYYETTNRR